MGGVHPGTVAATGGAAQAGMDDGRWTALVLAGQRPGVDPLAAHFGQEWKALVPLTGDAMLTHVLRTLHAAPAIGRIIILAQTPGALQSAIDAGGGGEVAVSQSGISASIRGVAGAMADWPVLVVTADHPLLTPAMIADFVAKLADAGREDAVDVAIAMVERANMLARFPHAQRTWLRFADGAWSGANLFALTNERAYRALDIWAQAEQDRKKPWKLFRHFGWMLAIRAVTRTIGLRDALAQAGRRMGVAAHLVAMDDPVAAIDVDKLADHQQAAHLLHDRAGRG
ncbi:MAG: NTP transferase domain-containing protein [Sphingopyxis sp.]